MSCGTSSCKVVYGDTVSGDQPIKDPERVLFSLYRQLQTLNQRTDGAVLDSIISQVKHLVTLARKVTPLARQIADLLETKFNKILVFTLPPPRRSVPLPVGQQGDYDTALVRSLAIASVGQWQRPQQ